MWQLPATWSRAHKTLIATTTCRQQPALLADALCSLIGRDDLKAELKLVLKSIGAADPSVDTITDALNDVELTAAHYQDTLAHWRDRFKENTDRLRSGELRDVADVLRSLARLASERALSYREKRMMEKAPDDRFQTADAVATALKGGATTSGSAVRPSAPASSRSSTAPSTACPARSARSTAPSSCWASTR